MNLYKEWSGNRTGVRCVPTWLALLAQTEAREHQLRLQEAKAKLTA